MAFLGADTDLLIQFLLNGVVTGSVLALAAIGLTLVYGILNLSNFAHGDFLTLGAYAAFFFNVVVAFDQTVLSGAVVGLVLVGAVVADRLTVRGLSRAEGVALLSAGAFLFLYASTEWVVVGLHAVEAPAGVRFLLSDFVLATLLAVVVVPVVAVLLDLVVWRPLRRRRATALTLIIVSIGLALFLRNALLLPNEFQGVHSFARPVAEPLTWTLFGEDVTITQDRLVAVLVSAALILGVHLLLAYTRTGKALRALSDNVELARVSGIPVDRMILHVWVLAGALAAVAGVLLALISTVHTNLGWNLLLPTFAAIILGGIGSPYGAMLGAFTIGIAMELTSLWELEEYRLGVAFLVLIGVLLVRPQGILGGKVA